MRTRKLTYVLGLLLCFAMIGRGETQTHDISTKSLEINADDGDYIITQTPTDAVQNSITINGGKHTITLQGVNINGGAIKLLGNADVTIEVKEETENTITAPDANTAAIDVAPEATLTLTGKGDLKVEGKTSGDDGSAGIGGNATTISFGKILINMEGKLESIGGMRAAGIGGGGDRDNKKDNISGFIQIKSGTIKAKGGTYASAIGLGPDSGVTTEGDGLTVIVEGGDITAETILTTEGPDREKGIGVGRNTQISTWCYLLGGKITGNVGPDPDAAAWNTFVVAPQVEIDGKVSGADRYENGFVFEDGRAEVKGDVKLPEGIELTLPDGSILVNNGTLTGNIKGDGVIIGNTPEGWDGDKFAYDEEQGGFQLASTADLKLFAKRVNDGTLKKVSFSMDAVLTSDIEEQTDPWTPIGTDKNPYSGIFDGNGKTVKVQMVSNDGNSSEHAGLFGVVDKATIKNLTALGSLTGNIAGGIAAMAIESNFESCHNEAEINGVIAGGIVGKFEVYLSPTSKAGSSVNEISYCYNTAEIKGSKLAAGICTRPKEGVAIKNCYNIGKFNNEGTAESPVAIASIAVITSNNETPFPTVAVTDCYYLNDVAPGVVKVVITENGEDFTLGTITPDETGNTPMTEEQFLSGEVAYKLNTPSSTENAFGQFLGEGGEKHPVLMSELSEEEENSNPHTVYEVTTNIDGAEAIGYYNTIDQIASPSKTGYDFAGWYNSATDGEAVTDLSGVTTIYARFNAQTFTITVTPSDGGSVSVAEQAATDATVELTISPNSNYKLKSIAVTDEAGNNIALSGSGKKRTFLMPASNVTVAATFRYDPPYVPSYYDIRIEECEGVTLTPNQNTVKEGGSFTLTAEVAEGYDPETLTVEYSRGRYGTWNTLEEDEDGKYRIKNVWDNIYVRATAEKEDPTAIESVEDGKPVIRTAGDLLCITLSKPSKMHISDLSGRVVRAVRLSAGYNEISGLASGLYIVTLDDGTSRKIVIR